MNTKPVGENDAWYPAPQLTAPERAMLESAIALGFPPAPRRAGRPGEGTEVVSVEPRARARDGTVLTSAEALGEPDRGEGERAAGRACAARRRDEPHHAGLRRARLRRGNPDRRSHGDPRPWHVRRRLSRGRSPTATDEGPNTGP